MKISPGPFERLDGPAPPIFAAMPPLAARRRPAQFASSSVLKCREEASRMLAFSDLSIQADDVRLRGTTDFVFGRV
jgi:hypothetical protein